MRIQTLGTVNDRLTFLGTRKSCVYLVKGEAHALMGGAGQWVVPELERQFHEWNVDMDRVRYLVLGHAHFDHCGAVPFLLRKYPHLQVIGSRGAAKLLGIPKAVQNIQKFSREATLRMGFPMEHEGISLEWEKTPLARVVEDGDILDLGQGMKLEFHEAPGHSRCGLITYIPSTRWLFPSDCLFVPSEDGENFLCTASESYQVYRESLQKIAHLETELCAWEHHGIWTGDDARGIVAQGIAWTRDYQSRIREALAAGQDPEQLALDLSSEWLERAQFPFLVAEISQHIMRGMTSNATEEPLD